MLLRYFVFWFITLVIIFAANAYIENSSMYASKAYRVDLHYQNIGKLENIDNMTLIIGNSYVNASFLPKVDDKNFYKFIVSGIPLDDIVNVIETLPLDTGFKNIVVGLGYNYSTPVLSHSNIYKKYSTENWLSRLWWSAPLVRGHSLASTIVREDAKCIFRAKYAKQCTENLDEEIMEVEIIDNYDGKEFDEKQRMSQSVVRRYKEFSPYMLDVSSLFKDKLNRIKEACAKRNIKLYTYTAPIFKDLRVKLNDRVLQKFRLEVEDVGIPYVDLNLVFPDWDYFYFGDASHVNSETGGLLTTQYIMDFMNKNATNIKSE